MTATLRTSQETPRDARADAIVVGVTQGPDGPRPAPGAEDVDAALGGKLAETLAALGATGKADEVTKIASAERLAAPLIAAVGLGEPPDANPGGAAACWCRLRRRGPAQRGGRGGPRAGRRPGTADRARAARA